MVFARRVRVKNEPDTARRVVYIGGVAAWPGARQVRAAGGYAGGPGARGIFAGKYIDIALFFFLCAQSWIEATAEKSGEQSL